MTRALFIAGLVTIAGCGRVDLCGGSELENRTCVTVHVKGELNAGVSTIDSLQVDVFYRDAGFDDHIHRSQARLDTETDAGAASLPLVFALVYPSDARTGSSSDKVILLARSGGLRVGLGASDPTEQFVMPGKHGHLDITLQPAAGDSCFAIGDCSTNRCPACGPGGDRCTSSNPCIDGFQCTGSTGTCVPGL